MAAIYCPIKTSDEYLEMIDVFKDSTYVHKLWHYNNGNPLDKDHKGNASILFEELMELNDGDRAASLRMKSTVFNEGFLDFFGNWIKNDYKPETHDVYENGEPFTDTFLDYTYAEDQTKIHPDPSIRADIRKYDENEITDLNNNYVWAIEKRFGLVDNKRWGAIPPGKKWKVKKLQGFSSYKALKIIKELEKEGIQAYPTTVHYLEPNIRPRTGVQVRVDIGRPASKKVSAFREGGYTTLGGQDFKIKYADTKPIKAAIENAKELTVPQFLAYLSNTYGDLIKKFPELAGSIELILGNRNKFENLKIRVEHSHPDSGTYMAYRSNDHSIGIYINVVLDVPTLEGFISSFVHEMGHALVFDAIENPKDNIDRQLKKTMTEIWSAYVKQKNKTNENAAEDVHEFIANFFTDARLRSQLKEMSDYKFSRPLYKRVIDAIIDWFRLKTGYQIRKKHEGNLNDFVDKTLRKFFENKTEIRNVNRTTNATKKAKVKNSLLDDIQSHVDAGKPGTIKTALKAFGELFAFDEVNHKYSLKADPTITFKSVTQINAEHGYGVAEEDIPKLNAEELAILKEGGKLGKATHMTAEEIVTGVVKDIVGETGYSISDAVKDRVQKIINDIEKTRTVNGIKPILMSEVTVGDISKGIAGTIDLVVIDSLGRVDLYDFKTKKGGFEWYTSTKKGKSNQSSYRLQLSAYKLLLEEVLGGKVRVNTMNIIQLVPTINEETKNIITLSLDTQIFSSGMDSFVITPLALRTIYGTGRGYSWDSVAQVASLDADVLSTPGYKLEQIEINKLTTLEEVYRSTMRKLESKVDIMRRRYSFTKRRSFEEHFNIVSQIDSSSLAIIEIIKYAAKVTNALSERYKEMSEGNLIFTPALLQEWKDYILAYDSLDSLQSMLDTNPDLLNNPTIKLVLDDVIKNKNIIKNAHVLKGKEAVAKRLVPYFDMIRVQRKEELESLWRKMAHRVKHGTPFKEGEKIGGKEVSGVMTQEEFKRYGKDVNEFVDYHLSKESDDIDKATYELLLKELSVAANDVNEAVRWVDALVDTTDPIAAAIVSAFNKADEANRLEALDKKIEFYRICTRLEKERGKTGMTSERKHYDEILEISDRGSYLIRPFLSSLEHSEREIRDLGKKDDSGKKVGAWIQLHFPLKEHEDAYLEAMHIYLVEQYKVGLISVKDVNAIMENETHPNKHFPISSLAKPKIDDYGNEYAPAEISTDASDIAINWKAKNRKLYSTIDKTWHNPKWDVFMKRIGISTTISIKEQYDAIAESTDPMAQMYNLLVKTAEEADSGIPYSHRLGYRLPGVYKNVNENLREGTSIASSFKNEIQLDFIRKKGDVEYNPQEYTDEVGNPKYFLPVHYINKLTEDKQSYDLPTIYFKYWDSANDYANKRDILPTIEMAKHFVETRVTEKKDSMGRAVLRSLRSIIPGFENESAVTKNSSLVNQLNDWFQMYVYGNTAEKNQLKITDDLTLDIQKFVDGVNKYTSVNLLALNVVQGFANLSIGELMQGIEAIVGEYVTIKSYTKASRLYAKWLPGMLGDVGRRMPESLGSLIIQQFNAMNEDLVGETEFANKNKMKALAKQQAFATVQMGGEHILRSRFLYAMIENEIRAIDNNGKDIGSMIDFYYVKNGKLAIKDEVNLKKSKWTEEDQRGWGRRFRGIADRVHGAYSLEAKVAAQRYFLGKLAYMFRKFVVPGVRRRYGRKAYSERLHQTTEGNYITTYKFFKKLYKEILGMKLALLSEEWVALSPHEQANIKRTISELVAITSLIILSGFAYSHWSDAEDEDDRRFWAFLAYQGYRLKTELLFFSTPGATIQILRSPMASMSVLENVGKTWEQMFNPLERYQRGPWKGRLKMERDIVQLVPIIKQYFKMRDVQEQIIWFK